MEKSRRSIIYDYVRSDTLNKLESKKYDKIGVDAFIIALDLGLHRSNVSMELNKLWKDGHLVKKQGRPTLFFDQTTINKKHPHVYIPSYITISENLVDFFEIGNHETNSEFSHNTSNLSSEMISAISAIAYPPCGLPLLVYGDEGTGKFKFVNELIQISKDKKLINRNIRIKIINCLDHEALSSFSKDQDNRNFYILINPEALGKYEINQYFNSSLNFTPDRNERTNHLIIICTSSIDSPSLNNLTKIAPITVRLPNLEETPPINKLKIISDIFKKEAKAIDKNISININLFITFCEHLYEFNLNSVSSEVQKSIALALYRLSTNDNNTVSITFDDLSSNIKNSQTNSNQRFKFEIFFSDFENEYVFFTKKCSSNIDEIIGSGSDDLEFALKSFNSNFKINGSNLHFEIQTLSNIYFSFFPNDKPSILNKFHADRLSLLKEILKSSDYSKYLKDDLSIFVIYCFILAINSKGLKSTKQNILNPLLLSKLVKYKILDEQYSNDINLSVIETVVVELLNISKNENPQVLIVMDNRNQIGIYESILNQLEDGSYYVHYADQKVSSVEIKRDIDQIMIDNLRPIDTLIITDIYNVFRNRFTLKGSFNISLEVIYPLSLPLLDKCISNLKSGYLISDFKDINSKRFEIDNSEDVEIKNLENNEFITKLSKTLLENDLNFIDARKITPLLTESLESIIAHLQKELTKDLIVKFIVHCSFMLERVIKNESIIHPNLKEYYNKNSALINIIKINFKKIEETFGITIPPMETAYIADIFINQSGLN